jgi:hypothetical protein
MRARLEVVTTEFLAAVRPSLPLRIAEVAYSDPTVSLLGRQWSLTLVCRWRLESPTGPWFSWDDDHVEDLVWELAGHSITGVERRESSDDPVFLLDGGLRLVVIADTDPDPWILRLADLVIVGGRAAE